MSYLEPFSRSIISFFGGSVFIKIYKSNYFVIIDNKSPLEIFDEIFPRMEIQKITKLEKRKMISEIKKQLLK